MKPFLILIFGLLLVAGCSGSSESEKNVAIAKAMFDAFNQHDWQKMASLYSEDATFLDPSLGTTYVSQTREQTATKYAGFQKMFPDIHDEVIGIYPSGDKVTVEFVSTGTVSDSIKFSLPIVSILTFKDGLIVKDATYYDLENP